MDLAKIQELPSGARFYRCAFQVNTFDYVPPREAVAEAFQRKQRKARRLSDDELGRRAEQAHAKPGRRETTSTPHDRSPWVAEHAKRRAKGYATFVGRAHRSWTMTVNHILKVTTSFG